MFDIYSSIVEDLKIRNFIENQEQNKKERLKGITTAEVNIEALHNIMHQMDTWNNRNNLVTPNFQVQHPLGHATISNQNIHKFLFKKRSKTRHSSTTHLDKE